MRVSDETLKQEVFTEFQGWIHACFELEFPRRAFTKAQTKIVIVFETLHQGAHLGRWSIFAITLVQTTEIQGSEIVIHRLRTPNLLYVAILVKQ